MTYEKPFVFHVFDGNHSFPYSLKKKLYFFRDGVRRTEEKPSHDNKYYNDCAEAYPCLKKAEVFKLQICSDQFELKS